jgi:hypothetical protein
VSRCPCKHMRFPIEAFSMQSPAHPDPLHLLLARVLAASPLDTPSRPRVWQALPCGQGQVLGVSPAARRARPLLPSQGGLAEAQGRWEGGREEVQAAGGSELVGQ